jgi:hypothetical protein
MRNLRVWLVLFCVLASATAAYADDVLDCSKKSLADAVRDASNKNPVISFTGICAGPIAIAIDGLTLRGVGTAIIDGGGLDAVTVIGASRVSLIDIDVTNGVIGILARNGADVSLTRVNAHDNSSYGISLQTASSGVLSDVTANSNGRGLGADDGVSVWVRNSTLTGNVTKDIQLTFGARADFQTMVFGTYTCDATVLVRGTSGITCPH